MHWIKNAYHKNILMQLFNPLVNNETKAPIEKTKEPTDFSLNVVRKNICKVLTWIYINICIIYVVIVI